MADQQTAVPPSGLTLDMLKSLCHSVVETAQEIQQDLRHKVPNQVFLDALGSANICIVLSRNETGLPIFYANARFLAETGYGRSEVIGRNCALLQGPGTDAAVVQRLREALRAEAPVTETLLNYRRDGTPFWNELHLSPIRDASNAVYGFIGVQKVVDGPAATAAAH